MSWASVQEFADAFRPGKMLSKLTGWLHIDKDYPIGDCENFALTALVVEAGGWVKAIAWILTFKAVFWFAKSPVTDSARHTVLYVRGKGWIDSIDEGDYHFRQWRQADQELGDKWLWVRGPAHHDLKFPWLYVSLVLILWGSLYKMLYGNTAVEIGADKE